MSGEDTPRLPTCAVIGAGVLGVCVALRLAEAGVAVTLLEQDRPGQSATRSSLAWLNANDKLPRAYHDLNYTGDAGFLSWLGCPVRPARCHLSRGRHKGQ
jgi:glycine/D-amino acid oxidase-like deaminating enzyme